MELNEYQDQAWKTAIYPNAGNNIAYPALKLCGETGELVEKLDMLKVELLKAADRVAELVGKSLRDGIDDEFRIKIALELGDVLWYISATSRELKFSLEYVAWLNLNKLAKRQQENKIHGSGDAR
jgi:NTP pyrophosphatase (non-canonical NTP hydrolase)